MKKRVKRTEDEGIYLSANRYDNPKETTKFVTSVFEESFDREAKYSVLDIGCAAGEFLFNLEKNFINLSCYGIDISEKLISKAAAKNPNVKFATQSILKPPYFGGIKFDAIFCLGVVSIFDDFKEVIDCILTAADKNCKIYITSCFNKHPFDVLIKYRKSSTNSFNHWESGFNKFSIKTVEEIIDPLVENYKWYEHKMPFALPRGEDMMRSSTLKTEEGEFLRIYSGIGLLVNSFLLEITV